MELSGEGQEILKKENVSDLIRIICKIAINLLKIVLYVIVCKLSFKIELIR